MGMAPIKMLIRIAMSISVMLNDCCSIDGMAMPIPPTMRITAASPYTNLANPYFISSSCCPNVAVQNTELARLFCDGVLGSGSFLISDQQSAGEHNKSWPYHSAHKVIGLKRNVPH
jgi:hypothetical protein